VTQSTQRFVVLSTAPDAEVAATLAWIGASLDGD